MMLSRIWKSALLSAAVVATSAHAKDECYPWETSVGETGVNDVSVGAELCYKIAKNEDGNPKAWGSYVDSQAIVDATVFEMELELASWLGGAILDEAGEASAYAELIVAGQEVFSESIEISEIALEKQFDLIGFEQEVVQSVMIGPVPASITFGVMTDGFVTFRAYAKKNQIGLDAIPSINANAVALAGLGNDIVFIGFSGEIELLRDVLELNGKFVYPGNDEQMFVDMYGSNTLEALNGRLDALVKVGGIRQTKNLGKFEGIARQDIFLEETIMID